MLLKQRPITDWLPITQKEVEKKGWGELDVVLITGDAYVDHPSFGAAVIGRIIESEGFKIGIIPQPNWQDDLRDFKKFGAPKLFFAITAGNMDSMINHYTANKRLRSTDAYTPGGESKFRPDYALSVYAKIVKKLYPETPILIGGIEGSLRRITHYDYWKNQLMPNILEWSGADLLVYGMGEKPLREVLNLLKKGVPFHQLTMVKQTAYQRPIEDGLPINKKWTDLELKSHETCLADKKAFASNFKYVEQESNSAIAKRITQKIGDKNLIINPPFPTMSEKEIDASFDLPFTRMPHPKYKKRGPIPAYDMIKFSINTHRGCFGGCSFCTISAHQGKFIASRSEESILKEVDAVTEMPDFKGYLSDIAGPSANMYKLKGIDLSICDKCKAPSCIHPVVCTNLDTNHEQMTNLYQKIDSHPKIKKAFVGSGIRYDLLVKSYNKKGNEKEMKRYMEQLQKHHVSGRLKVAPEHTSADTLKIMRKPKFEHFKEFKKEYDKIDKKHNLNQQLIPYFISSHPACKEEDMANLAAETKDMGFQLEQVQDFTPTPMTVATIIYYSGYHPYTMKEHYVPKTKEDKLSQHRFFFWYKRENRQWIEDRLKDTKQAHLIKVLLEQGKKTPEAKFKGKGKLNTKSKENRSFKGKKSAKFKGKAGKPAQNKKYSKKK